MGRAAKARPGGRQRFGEAVGAVRRLPCAARAATNPVLLGATQARRRPPGHAFAEAAQDLDDPQRIGAAAGAGMTDWPMATIETEADC